MKTMEDKRPLMLLVDDDPDDQYLVRSALSMLDQPPRLACVNNGQDLFKWLEREPDDEHPRPELILLDLNMPHMKGQKVLSLLKTSRDFASIPVIVYTTSQSHRDIEETYRLGANSLIIKPGTFSDMVETMDSVCTYWFSRVALRY